MPELRQRRDREHDGQCEPNGESKAVHRVSGHAHAVRARLTGLARMAARTAVVHAIGDVRLTAGRRVPVAIRETRVTRRHRTNTARTRGRTVRDRADLTTRAAVVYVGPEVGLATVRRVAVAIREARVAGRHRADTARTTS